MRTSLLATTLLLCGLLPGAARATGEAASEQCKIAVTTLTAQGLGDDEKHITALLSETIGTELERRTDCRVLTPADIDAMLNFEADRQTCTDDVSDSCLAELGGALDVDLVVAGSIGRLGAMYKVQLRVLDIKAAKSIHRDELDVPAVPEAASHEIKTLLNRMEQAGAFPNEAKSRDRLRARLNLAGWSALGLGGVAALAGLGTAGTIELLYGAQVAEGFDTEDPLVPRVVGLIGLGVGTVGAIAAATGVGLLFGAQSVE